MTGKIWLSVSVLFTLSLLTACPAGEPGTSSEVSSSSLVSSSSSSAGTNTNAVVPEGLLQTNYNIGGTGFNLYNRVYAMDSQPDGKILVGGELQYYNGSDIPDHLVRIQTNGKRDTNFMASGAGFNGWIYAVKAQPDGKILVGGGFTQFNGATVSRGLIRLNTNGTKDTSFNSSGTGAGAYVYAIAPLSGGKILIGGDFIYYNGVSCTTNLLRLNADGTRDTTFNSGGNGFNYAGYVRAILVQSDGKILVGGDFTNYNNTTIPKRLIRLNADGSLDTTFNNGGSGLDYDYTVIRTLALQSDGKILAGGYLYYYNGVSVPQYLIRLNADGTRDTTFNNGGTGFNNYVNSVKVLSDGKILVGGYFTTYNGQNVPDGLVRLNSNGSLDTNFNKNGSGFTASQVWCVDTNSFGAYIAAGDFTNYNNTTCHYSLTWIK